ncbi:MAG: hypothetical protein LBK83_15810 [Treponema sp.]|jgi:hypothetical protein|nr:hypothetical protein [Treponema sp.]
MAETEEADVQAAQAEDVPINMDEFTLLQIIAYTNAEIKICKEKLENESSGRRLAHLQGKIPGCKFSIECLKEQFNLSDEMVESSQEPCQMADLSWEQLVGAQKDMETIKASDQWAAFLSRIDSKITELKDFLLTEAKKSRDMDISQGEYRGMTVYEKVFTAIKENVDFRKRNEPLFAQDDDSMEPDLRDVSEETNSNLLPDARLALPPPDDGLPEAEDYEDDEEDNLVMGEES